MPGDNVDDNQNKSEAEPTKSEDDADAITTETVSAAENVDSLLTNGSRVTDINAETAELAADSKPVNEEGAEVPENATVTAAENGTVETKPAATTDSVSSPSLSKRKFRITGLHYPGDDITIPEIVEAMLVAHSFHLWFEQEPTKCHGRKKGGLSLSFDNETSARRVYVKIKGLVAQGAKWKINAHRSFDEPILDQEQEEAKTVETAKEEDPERFLKLYVDQLVPSADQDLIYAIFGGENLKNVDVHPDKRKSDGSKCAVLTFHDRESTEQAKQEYDEFTVDDGDVSRPMRILLYVDYLNKLESDRLRQQQRIAAGVQSMKESLERAVYSGETTRRPNNNERKGKAGNLWSAQIAESRGEPVERIKAKDHGNTENQQRVHSRERRPQATPTSKAESPSSLPVLHAESTMPQQEQSKTMEEPPAEVSQPPPPQDQPSHHTHDASHSQGQPLRAEGELSAHELAILIEGAMERGRVNWAELNTLEDLWALVHHASKDAGWQPELSLKEAMAVALDRACVTATAEWQRDHLTSLIRLWKKELDTDDRSDIRKQLQLSESNAVPEDNPNDVPPEATIDPGANYTPPPPNKPEKRRKNKATKKALLHMMGVGALLADVKKDAKEEEEEKQKGTRKKKMAPEERKRKHSASESGEASTTTTEDEAGNDEETSNWEEGTASSSEYRPSGQKGSRNQGGKHQPAKPVQRKKQAHGVARKADTSATGSTGTGPSPEQMTNWMSTMMQTMGGGNTFQQQWMTQAMPMMMQMMPMLAQMMQAQRMMTAATANITQAQQQQQMVQMMQQLMPSFMAQSSSSAASHPPPPPPSHHHQQPAASLPWTQQPTSQPTTRSVNSAPVLPSSLPYYGHYQQPPPPPPATNYGSYGRREQQGSMFPARGNYSNR